MNRTRFLRLGAITALLLLAACQGLITKSGYDSQLYSPAFAAAEAGDDVTLARLLVNNPELIRTREVNSRTLLFDAANQGHAKTVILLIDNGADINARDNIGRTPLHVAAQNGFQDVVYILIQRHADINAYDMLGWTPLDRARKWHRTSIANLLASTGGVASGK